MRAGRFKVTLQILLVLALSGLLIADGKPTYVGALEQYKNFEGGGYTPYIRLAFRKTFSGWEPMPNEPEDEASLKQVIDSYPICVTWTVVSNGKSLGSLVGIADKDYYYANVGAEKPDGALHQLPQVETGEDNPYVQHCNAALWRPLMLVSNGTASDPEIWRRSKIGERSLKLAMGEFRRHVKAYPLPCILKGKPGDPHNYQFRSYGDEDILIERSYQSKDGAEIVGLRLNTDNKDWKNNPCRDNWDDFPDDFAVLWFSVSGGGAKFLGDCLAPIEADDVDGSGKSIWLFSYNNTKGADGEECNKDGYVLFWDGFSKQARFTWEYH